MNSKSKKMIAPIVITVLTILYYVAYFGLLMSIVGGIWKLIFGIFPLCFSVVMIKVCVERIREIKEGE